MYNELKQKIENNEVNYEELNSYEKIYFCLIKEDNAKLSFLLENINKDDVYFDNIKQMDYKFFNKLIPQNAENYKLLRFHEYDSFQEYAKNEISLKVRDTNLEEKISILKSLIKEKEILGTVINSGISLKNPNAKLIMDEIDLSFKMDNDVSCLFEIDVQQDIVLNEELGSWSLPLKKTNSIKNWASKFSDYMKELSINLYTNPTVRKAAVVSLVIGVAFMAPDAMADMQDSADVLEKMSNQLASDLNTEDCKVGGKVISVSKTGLNYHFQFGNYRIETVANGFDVGSSQSLTMNSKIGILKDKMDCGLDLEDAKRVRKIIETIIRNNLKS